MGKTDPFSVSTSLLLNNSLEPLFISTSRNLKEHRASGEKPKFVRIRVTLLKSYTIKKKRSGIQKMIRLV